MRLHGYRRTDPGLTLVEVVVVIFAFFVLAATLLAAVNAPRVRNSVGCVNHLKQLALAFAQSPATAIATGNVLTVSGGKGIAESIFQGMSNELASPRILVCPGDRARIPVGSFANPITARNASYFINLDSHEASPQSVLFGDDNLENHGRRVQSGLFQVSSNRLMSWTIERHGFSGNVALADGSVQAVKSAGLNRIFSGTNGVPVSLRLAIP
jgi:prepilin-type processing-associated H-X9-DG protein